jgi:uncharacterized Zn-binding protein involved in type VI secretion
MGQPAAKQGDQVVAVDVHVVVIGLVPTPVPHPFAGVLTGSLSPDVRVMGRAAATLGSTADNTPPHVPLGGPFVKPPTNRGVVIAGSATVRVNGRPLARSGDTALTCNDPVDLPVGSVVAAGTVLAG